MHAVAVKIAAGKNLKLDFRLEGDPLDQLDLHHVHATATGPSSIRSLDADKVLIDYSIPSLVFHGMSEAFQNVELRDVTAVIDSSKALPTPTPAATKKVSLPAFFPGQLNATNISLTMRGEKGDTIVKDFNIGLYPDREGKLSVDKLQIPGVHTWTSITGTTTYRNKNLYIHNLQLDEKNKIETVNVDTSKIGQGKLGLEFNGNIGGGDIASKMQLSAKGSSYEANTKLQAKDISLGQLADYLGQPAEKFSGDVKDVNIDLQGNLDQPSTWDGTIKADLESVKAGNFSLDQVKVDLEAKDGKATVHEAHIAQGKNRVELRGSFDLPKTKEGFGRTPGNLQISLDAPNLSDLTSSMTEPAGGSLKAHGNLKTGNGTADLNLKAGGEQIEYEGAKIGTLSADVSATKRMTPKKENMQSVPPPFYEGVSSSIQMKLEDVSYGDFVIDQVEGQVKSDGAKVSLSPLTVTRKENVLQVNGSFELPALGEKLINQPADLQFNLRAPELGDYWQSGAENKVTGQVQSDGSVKMWKGVASGEFSLSGREIAAQKLLVKELSAQGTIAENVVYLNDFTARLNEKNYMEADGSVQLQKPFHYSASMTANLGNLSTFEPLLNSGEPESMLPAGKEKKAERKKTPLAGSLVMQWNGQGDVSSPEKKGDLKFRLERARYADLQNLHADIEAHYTSREFNVPIFSVGSDKFDLEAVVQAKDSVLEVSRIAINQGKAQYGTAYAAIPFLWKNVGSERPLVPPNGKVLISFQSENLDLKRLFENLGSKPPAVGQLSIRLDLKGPIEQLEGRLDLQMKSLQAANLSELQPATFDLTAELQNNQLRVDGKIQQARIQPVQLEAHLPLDVAKMIEARKFDEQTPIDATVRMPATSINFLKQFIPGIRNLDGNLAMNVKIGGTIAQPVVSGSADASINVARLENATIPALTNFRAQLNFRDNALSFDRFGGDLAGGPFTVTGRITLPKLTEPVIDLRLKGNSILVARNDTVTVRVDTDVKLEGPLKAATVRGQILTTNSRFLKNIDIIPIGLPGRPVRKPPEFTPVLSFPAPVRDWKFDLTIKSKDPFLIRGNLATGEAIIDLKVTGTGLHPGLQGQVRLANFEATLPFSRLTIQYGFLVFSPDDPLNPRIEMHGTSVLRDYTIHVYIYGTALAPEAVFNSEPPLPQEEIISLLATGVTREELTGSGNVLASRAALLLAKQLYRKIFKKEAEPDNSESILDRLDVEFGTIDPRTGEQTTTARYRLTDHVVLVGEIGVQGDFSGLVKYLIRFR